MVTRWAMVFVDWDSARRIAHGSLPVRRRGTEVEVEEAITIIRRKIASKLEKNQTERLLVFWRIYHGWHSGLNESTDRKIFESFKKRYKSSYINNIFFGNEFNFGDDLLCDSPVLPLRYTLRSDMGGQLKQKMVDTALVVDLVHAASTRDYATLIVVGDDDDLLPGIIAAEQKGNRRNDKANIVWMRINNVSALPFKPGKSPPFEVVSIKD